MMADTQRPADTMTKYEAAATLGVSVVTLDKWIKQGRIRKTILMGRVVVSADDVRKVKAERETLRWPNGEE